jgi:hypothetical protein
MHQLHRLSGLTATICRAEALTGYGDVGVRPFEWLARPSGSNRKTTQM